MPGFGGALAGLGAGLGQFAQQQNQQQSKQLQDLLLALKLQDAQRQRQASDAAASFALSPGGISGGSSSGLGRLGGGMGGAPPMPQMPQAAPVGGATPPAPYTPPAPTGGFGTGGAASGAATLQTLLQSVSQEALPPGYRAVVTSGNRPGAQVAGTGGVSQHALGNAIDVQIIGPNGPIPNTGDDTTGLYEKLATTMYRVAPQLRGKLAWGGNFTTGPAGGPKDLMHFDLGGDRGRFGTLAAEAGGASGGAAPQQPQAPPAASNIPPPPDPYDPNSVARALKQLHPEMDNQTLMDAVAMVGAQAAPQAKQRYDRWKNQADITLRQNQQGETGRHNVVEEGQGQQRIGLEAGAHAETGRHNVVEEGLAQQERTEAERSHKASEAARDKAFGAKVDKQQQATTLATTQMKTLADRARRLMAAVEADPSLVGGKGIIGRAVGSIGEQTGFYNDPKLAARDNFRSELQLLQTQLQKPLLGSRYFSGKAQERLDKVVPGMERLDNPTLVKSALRNIAESLEETAGATEAASRGVGADFSHLSDQELLQQLGAQPQQ